MNNPDLPTTLSAELEDTSDLVSKLTLESPRPRKKVSLGQRMRMIRTNSNRMIRNNSKKLLTLSPTKSLSSLSAACWGNESATETTLNCSMASLWEDYELAAQTLRLDIDQAIQRIVTAKRTAEQNLVEHFDMARARWTSGCVVGAALSMRKVHAEQTRKAYLAAARVQLVSLDRQVQSLGTPSTERMTSLDVLRHQVNAIVTQSHTAKSPTPSDEELLQQLARLVDLDETTQHTTADH